MLLAIIQNFADIKYFDVCSLNFNRNQKQRMTQRFYFDTSVFGGVFDIEFEEQTSQLFERVKTGQLICV